MTVKIGDRAVYRPRVPYGRQSELFCFVTRVVDAEKGIVDLVAFPAGGEFQHINSVSPRGEVIQIHCWEPYVGSLEARISELEARIVAIDPRSTISNVEKTPEQLADEAFLEGAQWTPEQIAQMHKNSEATGDVIKRGPGRPRKAAAA